MKRLLYVIGILVLIGWAVLFFGFKKGDEVHMMLVVAFFTFILGAFIKKKLVS